MTFAYYQRLTPAQQRLYRASDAVTAFLRTPLPEFRHSLAYELLRFPESLRTVGFSKGCHGVEGRRRRWLR